jgi:hypothetical protein
VEANPQRIMAEGSRIEACAAELGWQLRKVVVLVNEVL